MTKRTWLRAIWIGGVLLLLASFAFSRALRAGPVRRYLIAHLAASFGRPVEVSWFDFSLLDGARIEAHFVSVSDDPQFGNEYFLRSDTLTAGLRWTALLTGRFEFGSVSLSRPSLNMSRDAQGHWNVERWLPPAAVQSGARPGFVGPVNPSSEIRAARPVRIDVDGGRINFKQGDNKISFALEEVSGRVEQNGAGRWQLDLEARPMRAGVELQDIGTLRLRGSIAGTSARLQPADLNLTWRAASLADTLRLVRQSDYGMRGRLALDLNARIAPEESSAAGSADSGLARWSISGVARLTGVHGWRLTGRDSDPAANLSVEMSWKPSEARAEIQKLLVEMPASRLQGGGELDWGHGLRPDVHFDSSTVSLSDLLSWYRALQPDVAEDLRADGVLGLDLKLGGWPIQLQQGALSSAGGTLTAKSLPVPLRVGPMNAKASLGRIDFAPLQLSFAPASSGVVADKNQAAGDLRNSFAARGTFFSMADPGATSPVDWDFSIEGATSRAQDWIALSSALAQPINSDWSALGGLAMKMRATHRPGGPAAIAWLGSMDFLDLDLRPAFINQPVHLPKAHVEFTASQRTIALDSAEAFGAAWHGSIARKNSDKQWTFDLSADKIDTTDLDRWLGPRARPGFFSRFTGSNSEVAAAPIGDSIVTRLTAAGRLRVGMIEVPPMHIEEFDGRVELAGRAIQIRKAQADFFGGKISGAFDARLLPDAAYNFQGRFDRVDLAQLGNAVPFLNDRIGGNVSGTLTLSAHGIGRQDLVRSMQGEGTLNGRNIALRGFDLSSVFPGINTDTAPELFSLASGTFGIQNSGIELTNFALDNSGSRIEAEGRIDFDHALRIQVRPFVVKPAAATGSPALPGFLLGGTIEAPNLVLPPAAPKPAAQLRTR